MNVMTTLEHFCSIYVVRYCLKVLWSVRTVVPVLCQSRSFEHS
jgi:hypothetical protein